MCFRKVGGKNQLLISFINLVISVNEKVGLIKTKS